ncbi:MAG: pyridoxal phosphate-dependent aminotransferase [Anaerolineaceae bacterium]|nr:pyridoxal phosphate-dependent aminotransferase [Anaerolineaceae bacterium]
MIYNFDAMPNRRDTESVKWNHFDADVLPMWVADMDFVSPEPVIRALHERVAHGVFGYAGDFPGLRQTIVGRMEKLYHWSIRAEDIVFVPGVVTGFNMAGHAYLQAGNGMLSQTPVYMPFLDVARNVGCLNQEMELTLNQDGTYSIDWDAFENAITEQTSMFLFCNPHNPVGRVYTRHELERIAEICTRHDLLICSDEIHCDLLYSGQTHIPIASLDPELAQRCVTVMAPSKTFNIAGLSCSFAIIQNPQLRIKYMKAGKGLVHGVNLLGLAAARAAYQEGQEWLDQLLVYLEGNRDLLSSFVNEQMPGVCMVPPEGTYLAWLDCREAGIEGKLSDFFKTKARVAISDGEAFGKGGKGFVRLNFGCPRSMLLESLQQMKKALETR